MSARDPPTSTSTFPFPPKSLDLNNVALSPSDSDITSNGNNRRHAQTVRTQLPAHLCTSALLATLPFFLASANTSPRAKALLIDLNGTLHVGSSTTPRAVAAIERLRKAKVPFVLWCVCILLHICG